MRRLLIANRGEIVCRIMVTARRLGLTCIAVYSDADRDARHVRLADEAYHLGASPAAESYLAGGRIIALAQRVGADAVHPGYGFLSENAAFAQGCTDAGLVFIGPPAAAVRAMGSKSASKAAMAAVGVPVAAGYHGDDQSLERLCREAGRVGFPLIIKASAGGGGKGMQVVHAAADVAAATASAQRLARAAFADDTLLLERYFPRARHVEVQVLADAHDTVVALLDRDCSVQRRHQKIIEEAPAPGLGDAVRAAMSAAAITAARAVAYRGAGTVEFLVDTDQSFYFMEMNTRLQVEHGVTELITGIDLVEWQIRVARGEPLPPRFASLPAQGVAIEARLYAEDPAQEYLPGVGRISHLRWPAPTSGLRVDAGVDAGDEVSPFYDPMLGKIMAWGESRAAALDGLSKALRDVEIIGVATNRALLAGILDNEEFRRAPVATDFLSARRAHLVLQEPPACEEDYVAAALWLATRDIRADALWHDTRGFRLGAPPRTSWHLDECWVSIEMTGAARYLARIAGREHALQRVVVSGASLEVEWLERLLRATVIARDDELHVFMQGRHSTLRLRSTEEALTVTADVDAGSLLTPLPGTVVALYVAEGDVVARGAPLITVEAMKMEHTLTAPYAGTVARVLYSIKDRVAAGAVLLELMPADDAPPPS